MYVTQSIDTTKEAELYQVRLLRAIGEHGRWEKGCQITRRVKSFCLFGIQSRESDFSIIRATYEKALGIHPGVIRGNIMTWSQDPRAIGKLLHSIFEELAIPYFVTGGVASILYGIPRSTIDLDVVVEVTTKEVDRLVSTLEAQGFYVPYGAVEEVKRGYRDTLSVTQQEMADKVDISLSSGSLFDRSRMTRRVKPDGFDFYLCSAEDTVLQKLKWGKRTQSEKQWNDVLGILKMQQNRLDFEYMRYWAANLGIQDDLERAIASCQEE